MNINEAADRGIVTDLEGNTLRRNDINRHHLYTDEGVKFAGSIQLGKFVDIEAGTNIGDGCLIEDAVIIGADVHLGDSVQIGDAVVLREGAVVFDRAQIGQGAEIQERTIIGEGVRIPHEAVLGAGMIVPSQKTILTIGRLGLSGQTVTIHGSDDGPRISLGHHSSVRFPDLFRHSEGYKPMLTDSPMAYSEFWPSFEALGQLLQRHYEDETEKVAMLRAAAARLIDRTAESSEQ